MNKIIKTYAAYGVLEWVCQVKTGKCVFTIPFNGGAISAGGVVPAIYSTDNPVFQAVIERSEHYKLGKIKLLRSSEAQERKESVRPFIQAPSTAPAEQAEADAPREGEAEDAGDKVIEVSDIDAAREYLIEHHDYNRSDLRSKVKILEAAKSCGIAFIGLN